MEAPVTVTVDSGETLTDVAALRDWLSRENLVRSARLSSDTSDPEAQGGFLDTISVVLADGAALATLIEAVRRWISSRRGKLTTVTVRSGDRSITVTVETGQQ